MSDLRAGVHRADITPEIGISMGGYYARDGVSVAVERPLTATSLVLSNGSVTLAIIACDLLFIQSPVVDEIRKQIADAIGTDASCVLVNCSHTHCGPSPVGFTPGDERQNALHERYLERLKTLLISCAYFASQDLRPVRAGFGRGTANVGINRRELDADGKAVLGENPSGPIDKDVSVIRVDELDGKPFAILFAYGCHTVTMGPKYLGLTPDFPGRARELIENATGATSLFLQGAAGNINPVTGIGSAADDTDNMTRLGYMLGGEALKVAMGIRTHEKRGPRTLFASLSKNYIYPFEPVQDTPSELSAIEQPVKLPMLPLPSLEDARKILEIRTKAVTDAQQQGLPAHRLVPLYRFRDWARILYCAVENGNREMSIPLPLQAIRINDIAVVAAAGETLTELGISVKQKSPFEKTIFLGYSNGCIGYIPPAEAYPSHGWSPWETYSIPDMLFQSYQLPMALSPECGQMVVDHSLHLLNRLQVQLAAAPAATRTQS